MIDSMWSVIRQSSLVVLKTIAFVWQSIVDDDQLMKSNGLAGCVKESNKSTQQSRLLFAIYER